VQYAWAYYRRNKSVQCASAYNTRRKERYLTSTPFYMKKANYNNPTLLYFINKKIRKGIGPDSTIALIYH
jgi:hypothetical protein